MQKSISDLPPGTFVKLKPLAAVDSPQLAASFEQMAKSLEGSSLSGTTRFTIISGQQVRSFTISLDRTAKIIDKTKEDDKRADFEIVTKPETWLSIAEGKLAPLDAFTQGKMRVRGDHKLGLQILTRLAANVGQVDFC